MRWRGALSSGPIVYTLFPHFPKHMDYTIALFAVTSGSGDRPREEGCQGGGVYSFYPRKIPKDPAILKIPRYYAVVFSSKWCPRKGVAIVNHCVIVNLPRIVNLLSRSMFSMVASFRISSWRGPLGFVHARHCICRNRKIGSHISGSVWCAQQQSQQY